MASPAPYIPVAAPIPGLDRLWAETQGDADICVALLDGPVDLSHPCFEGATLTRLPTLVSGIAGGGPATRHGTHVASVIFGQPGSTVQGIAPGCRGLLLTVFGSHNGRVLPCSQLDLARAIMQAVAHGAHVINISGGEFSSSSAPHPLLARAVRRCAESGVLIVAAVGNDGCACLHVPAAVPSVLGVGAMDAQGTPLGFSNWGAAYQAQGILAPGDGVLGAAPGGGIASFTGTSFATPLVSGVAALLLSLQRKHGKKPDPHAVRHAILHSAVGCDEEPVAECRRLLAGRLHVVGALHHLMQGGTVLMSDQKKKKTEKAQVEEPARATVAPAPDPTPRPAAVQAAESAPAGLPRQPHAPLWMPHVPAAQVMPSDCGCGGGSTCSCGSHQQLVYAIGTLGYDFGNEARRDSYVQHFAHYSGSKEGDDVITTPDDPSQMSKFLGWGETLNPWEEKGWASYAEPLIWTLNHENTPIYAIRPAGAFATRVYGWLRRFLRAQLIEEVERVSIPGVLHGKATLFNGQVVPVIVPEQRGMWGWSTEKLTSQALGSKPTKATKEGLRNFLHRIYYEIQNLGLTSEERALNYAATNAFQVTHPFGEAAKKKMELDSIDVEKSAICRPGSDCWDVKLVFFDPENIQKSRTVNQFTIDVSDVIPVTVGEMRTWSQR